jgi:hypothetical protein
MTLIIPYTSSQLEWHLRNNVFPSVNESAIERIAEQCNLVNMGMVDLSDEVVPGSGVSVADMLEDLKIDYNN